MLTVLIATAAIVSILLSVITLIGARTLRAEGGDVNPTVETAFAINLVLSVGVLAGMAA